MSEEKVADIRLGGDPGAPSPRLVCATATGCRCAILLLPGNCLFVLVLVVKFLSGAWGEDVLSAMDWVGLPPCPRSSFRFLSVWVIWSALLDRCSVRPSVALISC